MVSAATLLKKFANVNNSIIDSWEFVEDSSSITTLKVHLHPYKSHSCRCPKCSQKCKIYDSRSTDRCWRAVDCGGIIPDFRVLSQILVRKTGIQLCFVKII